MKFCTDKPIGIIDSGIGGISVLKQLLNKFNGGNYIYYADILYMPYGNKSRNFINNRVDYLINLLQTKYKAKSVIIACNTASTSIDVSKYKNVYCMQFHKNYTYYATNLTKQNLPKINVVADKNLPHLIEKHIFNKLAIDKIVKQHVKRHNLDKYKEVVLGCTHYELVNTSFNKHAKNTKFLNNSEFVINKIHNESYNFTNIYLLTSKKSKSFTDKFFKLLN